MASLTFLGRYLSLLDRFLEGIPPQDIEAVTIPTLEEVSQTLGAQDALWIDRALAAAPSEFWFSALVSCLITFVL